MRIALTVTDRRTGSTSDLVVRAEGDTTVDVVVRAVAPTVGAPADPRAVLGPTVDGREVDARATVDSGVLLDGSHLEFGEGTSATPAPRDLLALHVVGGPGAGTVHVLAPGDAWIGRSADATVTLPDDEAPELAVVLTTRASGPAELHPAEGVALSLDGTPVSAARTWPPGAVLRVGDTLLALRRPGPGAAVSTTEGGGTLDLTRQPRLLPEPPSTEYRLLAEPEAAPRRPLPIIAALAPLAMAGVMVTLFRDPAFLAFGLMSPLVLVGNHLYDRRHGRLTHRRRAAVHAAKRAAVEEDAAAAVRTVQARRRETAPDPAAVLDVAVRRRARVWERRPDDPDHLTVRVGTGDLPSGVVVEDPAELEHRRRVERPARDVPVTVSFAEAGVVGAAGHPDDARALAVSCVGQLATLQSPRDLEIVVLAPGDAEATWSFVRWLPHARPGGAGLPHVLVGNDAETLARRVAELCARLDARRRVVEDRSGGGSTRPPGPAVLVVVDGARRLRALPGLVRVLKEGPRLGVHALCLEKEERLLPEECGTVVHVGRRRHRVASPLCAPVEDVLADGLPEGWGEAVARGLAPLVDVDDGGDDGALPTSSRLLDVLDLEPPTPGAVLERWRGGGTTEVVLGESIDGPFTVELRRDGPHGLVAGTTGSGKSELLQTIVASLAATNAPDAMTFVLVDYKGGAAFRDCARLPHTVGMVTDLDAHLVSRALASLGAELRRREHVLAASGCKDLEDHLELRARDPDAAAPLPRLLIVIDEFASLVRELPDFVPGLVAVAQRGRSLGIHLVLATQRPAGVVSTEIRANTNLRVALRVTDAAESSDVLDAPDAARIGKATPGRAVVRLGAGALVPFQTARVGGRRPGACVGSGGAPPWVASLTWATLGRALPVPVAVERRDDARTDLQELVDAVLVAAGEHGGDAPHRPWLPPLPELLTLADLPTPPGPPADTDIDGRPLGLPSLVVPYGLQDLPAEQARRVAALDLSTAGHLSVVGAPRSGRTQFLRSLAGSIARTVSVADVHVHAVDCGGGGLLPVARLPHAGVVVRRTETERVQRLLVRLLDLVRSRQEVLATGGWADVEEQRASVAPERRLPHVVVLVDRWEGFVTSVGELDHGAAVEQVHALLREGAGVGLHLVLTGDRSLLTGRLSALVDDVLVLRLADRSDAALAGLDPRALPEAVPDGRGVVAPRGTETQIALLTEDRSGRAQADALARLADDAATRDAGVPPVHRPFRLERLDAPLSFDEAWRRRSGDGAGLRALVGVGGDDLEVVGPDLAVAPGTFLVGGPPRSGRSTVLSVMVRSLLLQDREVVVVTPRASPLRRLDPDERLHVVEGVPDVARLDPWFRGTTPRVLVVDDAELVKDPSVTAWLSDLARSGADRGHALVVGGTTADLGAGFGGWLADVRRNRAGALLSPQSWTDGDLVGVRLPRSATQDRVRPGLALVHLGDGDLVQVQVPFG